MKSAVIRLLQNCLKDAGLYDSAVDGKPGSKTDESVSRALANRMSKLPINWRDWPDRRKRVACFQLMAAEAGLEVGAIDGFWGPQTAFAAEGMASIQRTGALPNNWRDTNIRPLANPHGWPGQEDGSLTAFYGLHGIAGGRTPALKAVECPYPLKIAWNPRQKTRTIRCNLLVADSLERVLHNVRERYGDKEISALRLDQYGGCYAPRKMRGGSRQSTHSWAIALDFDPAYNQLNWGRDQARLAAAEYDDWWEVWEEEGWYSLGRRHNYDWMHIQATA